MKMYGGSAAALTSTYSRLLCLTAVTVLHAADVIVTDVCEEDTAAAFSLLQTQSTAILVSEDDVDEIDFHGAGKHHLPLPQPSVVHADRHRHLAPGIVPPGELHPPLAGLSRGVIQDVQDHAFSSDEVSDRLPRQPMSLTEKEATQVDLVNSFKLIFIALAFCCCISYCWNVSDYIDANRSKNAAAKDLRKMFDKECKAEEKAKYTSDEFKKRCDQLFKQADTRQSGHLTLKELRGPLQEYYGRHERRAVNLEVVIQAFDDNNNMSIESDEFFEMMKYFEWQRDEKAKEETEAREQAEAANAG